MLKLEVVKAAGGRAKRVFRITSTAGSWVLIAAGNLKKGTLKDRPWVGWQFKST